MNQYITFHKILDYLQEWVDGSPIMNTFGYGNLVDFGKNISGTTTPNYPFLFAVPQAITYDENTTTYQLTLIFADILNTDVNNEKDCVSDMSLQARRFLSSIKWGQNTYPYMYDNMDCIIPAAAIPFFERMSDHIAGVALDTNIIIFEDLNACNYYPETIPVYSQVLSFTGTPNYNSIQYRCSGITIEACYSIENQNNMADLVNLFNTPPPSPLPPSCDNPTFCYCWTDYGIYYDNGDGRIRLEMPVSLYNTLCPNGTLTLNVIND
jgi:hypothetical protein